ncbi:iron-containing alcohol dehydrogenase [Microbacterium ulmi]|nr:iron-containing alcohol dehydrogenase [Microbacterium ulmi]NII69271.1 alcohol dehydrogenase [Microbacterium ulmi]
MYAVLRSPLEIVFGAGRRAAIAPMTAELGRRALIVVDPFLATSPELAQLVDALAAAGVESAVYSDVVPELPTRGIAACADAARAFGADVLIAVGGGSSIDMAKTCAVLTAHGGRVSDYYGERRVPGPVAPIIAVPTTAGTGSEVTPVAVVTDETRQVKVGISSPYLIPRIAICDPELTLTCPPGVTAASGADALCHAIEALTARKHTAADGADADRVFMGAGPFTDSLALEAIRSLAAGLPRAWRDPGDLDARSRTMYGATLAGLAFGTAGTAAAHALQYPIGAATHTSHGIGVGLLLPHVMAHNLPARMPEFARIATALGADAADQDELAARAPHLVQELLRGIGIPGSLAEIGFPRERLAWAAAEGLRARRLVENNPVPLSEDAALAILESAYAGSLRHLTPTTTGDAR